MPDKKITDLVDGGDPQATDEFVVARGGDNFKLAWSSLSAGATAGNVAFTLDGNTAGVVGLVSSGTLSIAGGNNITLSQAGNAITISGANAAGAQTAVSGIANSQTTYTSGTVSLSELGAITIRSTTGNQFQFSVNSQSVQPETQTFVGGIRNSETTYTSGTVRFSELGAVTIRSTTGNAFQVSVNAQSVQPETQTFVGGIFASDTLYTSGTVRITGVGGGVTVSSNTGQRIDISVAAQSVQPETQTFIAGVSASDTLYTSGNVRFTGVGGGITVSSNTGQRVDLSVAAQTNQAGSVYAISNTSGTSSGTYDARTLSIAGAGIVTVAASNSGWRIDATTAAQTNQAGNVYASSNTFGTSSGTYDARSISIAGRGAVSVAASNSGWIISAPVQSVQAETQTAISGLANSQTTYTSGTVSLSELGAITIRSTTGNQFQFSVNSQTVQTQNLHNVTLSGNTAGAMAQISSGTLTLAGGSNITLSQAGNAVTISGASGGSNPELLSVNQVAHGLAVGDVVRLSGTSYIKAQANNEANAEAVGIVSAVADANNFTVQSAGRITGLSGLTAGAVYYLDDDTAGLLTTTEPPDVGDVSKPLLIADTTTSGWIVNMRGFIVAAAAPSEAFTLAGNTAGALALMSTGTVTLAGGANITLSQAGNAVTISAGGGAETQTFIAGVSASDTLYTSGNVRITGVGGGITVSSNTGQRIDLSVAAQSVQPETQTFIGGISASNTLYTSGSVRFTGSQAVTVRSGTGQLVVIDVPAQTTQVETQTFLAGAAASNTTYTSGTFTITGVGGGITVSSNTGQRIDLSVAAPVAQTNQAGSVYASSNTFGTSSGTYDARSISIAGRGIVSVAASNSGWIISASQSVQAETQTAVSGIANSQTTYTSGTVSLSELGAITIRSTTGNQFQLSVNSQTNQAGSNYAIGNTFGTSSGTHDARTLSIAGDGIISVAASNSGWRISASQSVQAETQTFVGGIGNSQTTYTSGTVNLSVVAGQLTIRSTTGNAFQFSASQSVQAETQTAVSGIANSQTTYTSGTVSWSELGAVTVRSTTGNQFQISVNSQTAQTQSNIAGIYDGANSISTGTVRLTNANGVTFSVNAQTLSASVNESITMSAVSNTTQSASGTVHKSAMSFAGAGVASVGITGGSVVISVPAGGGGGFSAGVSTGGNTAGATGISGTQMVLVGSNNITLSQTTGANGNTVSINAPASSSLSATGGVSISVNGSTISIGMPPTLMGVSTGGNTAGSTGATSTQLILVGTGPISLSQSTGAAGGTVSINAPATSSLSGTGQVSISTNGSTISIGVPKILLADWQNMDMGMGQLMTHVSGISKTPFYWKDILPGALTAKSLAMKISMVTATQPLSVSVHLGIYTMVNSTSAALLGSHSEAYVVSSATSVSLSNVRNLVMTGIGTHATLSSLSGGDYLFGLMFSATATNAMNFSLYGASTGGGPLGGLYPGTNNVSAGTSQGVQALFGRGSTTVNAMPAAVQASEVVNYGQGASMQLHPWIYIRS